MIKNAVSNGLNKVEITLKPKSLGKINLDISVKDNTTKIQINAENIESANILNENLGKLNELIEIKMISFLIFLKVILITILTIPKKIKLLIIHRLKIEKNQLIKKQ